jgi:hypothetical protein
MIAYLREKGYRYTEKDTLNPQEFRLSAKRMELNDDLSTFGHQAIDTISTYELFLSKRGDGDARLSALLDDLKTLPEVVSGSLIVDIQERGFLITIEYIVGD